MDRIKLKAVGDLNLTDIDDPLGLVKDKLAGADILIGNFQSLVSDQQSTVSNRQVDNLVVDGCNIVIMSLANNFISDIGIIKEFPGTKRLLDERMIAYFGVGNDLNLARKPYKTLMNGKEIGFLGYGWNYLGCKYATDNDFGVVSLNSDTILKDIQELKKQVDYIICYLYWGYPGEELPFPGQRELAHEMIDEGCNLILGAGPGVVQGIEEYEKGLIVYSLGRFVGKQQSAISGQQSASKSFIFDCEFWGDQIVWDIIPFEISGEGRPKVVSDMEFKRYVKEDLGYGFTIANYHFYWGRERRNKELGDYKF